MIQYSTLAPTGTRQPGGGSWSLGITSYLHKTICSGSMGTVTYWSSRMRFRAFQAAYPIPDKSADSTMDALKHVKGERTIERFNSDRSDEIDRALRAIHSVYEHIQCAPPRIML